MSGEREKVRRLGSSRIHLAEVPDSMRVPATVLGSRCTLVVPPVATVCRSVLKGDVVIMSADALSNCRTCERIGAER